MPKLSLEQTFQEAVSHHTAGRFAQAEQLYRSILQSFPTHSDTNHNLGILAAQSGQADVGLPYFERAFSAAPDHAPYLLSYANGLMATGQYQAAVELVRAAEQRGSTAPELKAVQQKAQKTLNNIKNNGDPTHSELTQLAKLYSDRRLPELEARAHQLIEKYPHSGPVWTMLAAALQSQKKNSLMAKKKAAQFSPLDADVHFNLGNEFYAQGLVKEAEQSYRTAIQIDPAHSDAYGNLGVLLNKFRQVDAAVACYKKITEIRPHDVKAHCILGGLLGNLGRYDEALLSCQRALQIKPDSVEALCNLGVALQGLGQLDEAFVAMGKALDINPDSVEAHINLGNVFSDMGRGADARSCYIKAIELQPGSALAHYNLASLLHDERDFGQAETVFRRAIQIDPEYVNAYTNLGTTLMELGKCDEALSCYIQALKFKPESVQALCHVGSAFHELGKLDEAVQCYQEALKFDPGCADALGNLGGILMQLGKLDEAKDYLNKALELDPKDARILTTALIYLPFDQAAAGFAELENVYARRADLPLNVRISFCIAYGKAMESVAEYDKSFQAYEEGNRLQFQDRPFDEAAEERAIAHTLKTMTKAKFGQFSAVSSALPVDQRIPVFIVGMQRSGSTLIEQILSSHPAVFGAGELMILGSLAGQADRLIQESTEDVATLSALRKLGDAYLEAVWKKAPQARFIIDKMPHNFYFVGLIHLMFPQAKIIHSIRDPIDTCFSGYALRFGAANEFTYDLETLGRYYVRYDKLMQHWHSVLPEGAILDVHYEENVANPEHEARRMLTYLDLPWDPSCLKFHENRRTVRTASVTQVRKPIYSSSVARWKHFEKHLGPLISILQSGHTK